MRPRSYTSGAALVVTLALFNGCAGSLSGVRSAPPSEQSVARQRLVDSPVARLFAGTLAPDSSSCSSSDARTFDPSFSQDAGGPDVTGGGTLFATNGDAIQEFYAEPTVQKPFGSLNYSFFSPKGVSVDSKGNLYVANHGANQVLVFPEAASSPSATYSKDVLMPIDAAANKKGVVYVVNDYGGPILVFPSPAASPTMLGGFEYPTSIAFDSKSDLYVVDDLYGTSAPPGAVFEFKPKAKKGTNLGLTGLDYPVGIAIDSKNDLFVTNEANNTVNEYAPGATAPKLTITSGLCVPTFIALNKAGDVFVSNAAGNGSGDVTVYPPNSGTVAATLTTHLGGVRGVAVNEKYAPTPTPKPSASPKPTPSPTP